MTSTTWVFLITKTMTGPRACVCERGRVSGKNANYFIGYVLSCFRTFMSLFPTVSFSPSTVLYETNSTNTLYAWLIWELSKSLKENLPLEKVIKSLIL